MHALSRIAATLALAVTAACSGGSPTPGDGPRAAQQAAAGDRALTQVVAVSIDGLNPAALRRLGREGAPTLHRLSRRGAGTLNARTEREQTETLPNHTGMVTGRRIDAAHGGHGVTWNDERTDPATVQEAAGDDVDSVFSRVHAAGGRTGLFVSKRKLLLFERSWPAALDRTVLREDNVALTRVVGRDLRRHTRDARLVHLSLPDVTGHDHGFMSDRYLAAVSRADRLVGRLLRTVRRSGHADDTAVIVTSDHGGRGSGHDDPTLLADYRVPFWVVGPGVERGADLYAINPTYADPGRTRTTYADERQPIRNGAVANLTLDLLGLAPVSHSEHDVDQDLRVAAP